MLTVTAAVFRVQSQLVCPPAGLEQKISSLSELKVKGLVVGPIHVAPADDAMSLSFKEVSSEVGNLEQFKGLVQAAHKKGEGGRFCPFLLLQT